MYRLLEVGEVIEKGDEFYGLAYKWESFPPWCVGLKTVPHDVPIRRLVNPDVTHAALPDPGEGYRLIDKAVDKPERGDQVWNGRTMAWQDRSEYCVGSPFGKTAFDFYRRRIEKPAPVVSVGDRVKVLSGPWAGCTGVVIALDAYVLLSDYGKMTAQYDSTPVIELEHVRVGGDKLILSKVTVEKLPPVVPEVLYRDLSHGETIRKGDEFFDHAGWREQLHSTGCPVACGKFRRPVRLQSTGWRYLDAGETVQAGDEAWSGFFNRYVPASADRGSVAQCEKLFRRKLPANQGN